MRLIDADALKKSIDEHVYLVNHGFNETEYGCTQYGIHQIIDDAPTIDAVPVSELHDVEKERDYWMDTAHSYEQTILRLTISTGEVPVKRGKWIETDEWDEFSGRLYKCSNCKTFVIGDIDNYCPYCGARMDKDERD